MAEERIFVAVGKKVKDSKATLLWALKNGGGKRIGILHVHQPAQMIPMPMGGKFPASKLKTMQVEAYRQHEKAEMNKILDEYCRICRRERVPAEKFVIEMDDIERGILELLDQHEVSILVMGAAADNRYSKRMRVPKSKKAITLKQEAPLSCQIWFVCDGNLVCTRDASLDGGVIVTPQSPITSPILTSTHPVLPQFRTQGQGHELEQSTTSDQDILLHSSSENSSHRNEGMETLHSDIGSQLSVEEHVSVGEGLSLTSPSQHSAGSTSLLSDHGVSISVSGSMEGDEEIDEGWLVLAPVYEIQEDEKVDDQLYDQLQYSMEEAANCKREAYAESLTRLKAEKLAIDTIRKAKQAQNSYNKEVNERKEIEDLLAQENLRLENIRIVNKEVYEEVERARQQQAVLESQVADSSRILKDLEGNLSEALQYLETLKKELDELQSDRDEAIEEAEELRRRNKEACSSSWTLLDFSEFTFLEIEEATRGFDPSLVIGEGSYGSVYKGLLRHTQVAIKMLHPHGMLGLFEFQQVVDIMSHVRHPNLVTLIGTCPEARSFIHEYLSNGNLQDRLLCKDNTPPLSWQIRARILSDICSALVFLQSNKPYNTVHGNLKPANVLLDANFVAKLADFGTSQLILRDYQECQTTTGTTKRKGTFAYMDPEFQSTGVLTPKSDVYAFGIIILQVLTGRPALEIVNEMKEALRSGNITTVLDESAGDWPFVQAKELADLGLRCCELNSNGRPDLETEAWRVIEPMRVSAGPVKSFQTGYGGSNSQIPSNFICPIFQEIMQDPHMAADGFSYEAEALRGWLDSGNDTSPMTNIKLAHCDLIPNRALRSAIQEWLQHL